VLSLNKCCIGGDVAPPTTSANNLSLVFKKSGASFSIAIILYLACGSTKLLESAPFLSIKYVSSSTLFLSDEGNDSHKLPSSAL